jgi:predicted amidohydrolase YtcJ
MAAAVDRRTAAGQVLGTDDAVPADRALGLFLGPLDDPGGAPRRVEPGAPGDLCVLDRPLTEALHDLASVRVTATLIDGSVLRP